MKMLTDIRDDSSGGRTVVVGVKLNSQSKELLTWSLVKVAQPGDLVLALHVLDNNEIVNRDAKSSLLSLAKAFDNVLAVYEGFCNLKQVDLKLKICRGSSVQKILVREVKSYLATKVIVGTAGNHHPMRSSSAVAKYLAKKLSKDCCVLAVHNGKIVFQREAAFVNKRVDDPCRKGLLNVIHRSFKNTRIMNEGLHHASLKSLDDENVSQNLAHAVVAINSDSAQRVPNQNCSICGSTSICPRGSYNHSMEESHADESREDNSFAIVPVQTLEAASISNSLLVRETPETKPGWPLLHRAILLDNKNSKPSSLHKISAVQWALQLPSRPPPSSRLDENQGIHKQKEGQTSELDGESGAIVVIGNKAACTPNSLDHASRSLLKELEGLHEKCLSTCRLFMYEELASATSDFVPENLIGRGGSSRVFRGCLRDGKEIAVKILKPSEDAVKEFVLEIEIITTLHHRNIISLLGFCFHDDKLFLVYDFLSKGNLEENLYGDKKKEDLAFGWAERYKVAVGIAEALDYLHRGIGKPVIHRDVKSSNILLSEDFEPQLSDFGLAKWASSSSSFITCTDVAGTFGYLAPEYFMYGKVNNKIDVYAFGVVLLELLSGRKPISSNSPKGQESLVMWAKPILNGGKVSELLDLSLSGNYDNEQMECMALAATLCIRRSPQARPQMSLVVKLLKGDIEARTWARLQVNVPQESDMLDDEGYPYSSLKTHLNVALLDVEDASLSMSSIEQSISLEDYLRGRWSRSSSFTPNQTTENAS